MSNSIKGSIIINEADGTDFSSPDAGSTIIPIPQSLSQDPLIDITVSVPNSVTTFTQILPNTVNGIFITNTSPSTITSLTIVATGAGTPAELLPGDVWGVVGVDVTALTISASATSPVRIVIWGE